jgi:hypothetical protein
MTTRLADHYEYFGGAWREVTGDAQTMAGDGFTVKLDGTATIDLPVMAFSRLMRIRIAGQAHWLRGGNA